MKDNKNGLKLYNVIFPFWMLILVPHLWLVIFPANFIIDSLVLIAAMFALKIQEKKTYYKKHIIKIFSFGMVSDLIGALYMLGMLYLFAFLEIELDVDDLRLTMPAMIISAVFIFILNYFVTFKKSEKNERLKMSLVFAIVTAPYTFLIPISWMY